MTATWSRVCTVLCQYGRRFINNATLPYMEIRPEIADALLMNRPVVALETTILTHGMPYPQNRQTAEDVENIVRSHGAIPATIGILDGKIHIGLNGSQLDRLSDPDQRKIKIAKRDIPFAISQKLCGGTTVSGTLSIAHKVGITLFVTGGIGGVHREGHITFDISADLVELANTPVGVVSAGIKSILDISRTLEILETLGVTVVTYGKSKEFPAFFTAKSNCYVDQNIESPFDCAQLLDINRRLGLNNGTLIAVPPPTDNIDGHRIEETIQQSLVDAKNKGITGKSVTPFILDKVNLLTGGQSLLANINLIKNNAVIGSQIAVHLSNLQQSSVRVSHDLSRVSRDIKATPTKSRPIVVGGSIVDVVAKVKATPIRNEGTNVGYIKTSYGGVARNIVECMTRLNCATLFITNIGKDDSGNQLLKHMENLNISKEGIQVLSDHSTATYCVVLDSNGEMYCSVGDMDIINELSIDWVKRFPLSSAPMICIDGNITLSVMEYILRVSSQYSVPIWFEPTCIDKSIKPVQCGLIDKLTYISPNFIELHNISNSLVDTNKREPLKFVHTTKEKVDFALKLSEPLLERVPHIFVTLGKDGLLYVNKTQSLHYPSAPSSLLPAPVVSVSGAGDCLAGGIIGGLVNGYDMHMAIIQGLKVAYESLQSTDTVSSLIDGKLPAKEWINIDPMKM